MGQTKNLSPFALIPFDLKSGYIVFDVPIEHSGSLSLLFDTGCQTTTFGKNALGYANRDKTITLQLGSQKLKIDDYHVNPRESLSKSLGQKVDGVIGNDILHRYTVRIDYENRLLSLFDREEFVTYPEGDDVGIEVNSLVSSVLLAITFAGGKKIEGEFVIDTGAPINVLINSPLAEKHGLDTFVEKGTEKKFKTQAALHTATSSLAKFVRIGQFQCDDMEIFISTSKKGLFAVTKYAGIVGNKFFQNFNVIFDYKRKRIHLEKY
ncbi:MAG: aspartyl protease family protein [Candidatus Aminicenantes bacterium]|nr:MAG: aspartyl protease family protein [Candidatus Aminicenantes bacterium]